MLLLLIETFVSYLCHLFVVDFHSVSKLIKLRMQYMGCLNSLRIVETGRPTYFLMNAVC